MTEPISLASKSPRYAIPMLFSGQAQKEFTVNQAHSIIDMLLHPAIKGETDLPPATPTDGECWLVGADPADLWSGQAGAIASFQSGTWLFITPRDGLRVFDQSTGETAFYREGWHRAAPPEAVAGGSVVDQQARTAIEELVESLAAAGILRPR